MLMDANLYRRSSECFNNSSKHIFDERYRDLDEIQDKRIFDAKLTIIANLSNLHPIKKVIYGKRLRRLAIIVG